MNQLVTKTLASDLISQEEKTYIEGLSEQEQNELFDPNYKFKFGTAGIRLPLGMGTRQLNVFTYTQLILGYIKYLQTIPPKNNEFHRVVLGRDNRYLSREAMILASQIFSSFGFEVFVPQDYEMLATPIVSYLINELDLDGGIMFTASHNPKTDNGFKVYNNVGAQPITAVTDLIETFIPTYEEAMAFDFEVDEELILFIDEHEITGYFDTIKENLIHTNKNSEKQFNTVLTTHHGAGSYNMPVFLESLGYEIINVNEQNFENPDFINDVSSNPEDQASFTKALEYAENNNATVMIGIDPDADRMGVAVLHDNQWYYLSGDQTGVLFAYYLLNNKTYHKNKYIISTIVSNTYVQRIADDFNTKAYYVGVGFKHHGNLIAELRHEADLVVAFEEAIGTNLIDMNNDKDGYQSAAFILELIAFYQNQGLTLLDVFSKLIFPQYGYWYAHTYPFVFKNKDWKPQAQELLMKLQNNTLTHLLDLKIERVEYNEEYKYVTWFLSNDSTIKFRLSGTEPKFKIYVNLIEPEYNNETFWYTYFENKAQSIIEILKNHLQLP
ncbi:phospho-sugar mutase [Ureaplasma miroungigenitalium]|uniref:Phospho-sugar mutase n=1 Tax=Ureaplasma miroungigenitalium TaxID=1042321 RepID=A0ABT3BMA0_9BACT|nr:phospho-sugar mutase [Ureaplasma miroungigenitalium]MCV3728357.1 phospho-sugar mutase [Ureaplasma miroungigenitalium]